MRTYNIYKITNNVNNKCYIGSTTKTIKTRLGYHKSDYKRYLQARYNYVTSFELIKHGNCQIELLESFRTNDTDIVKQREQHYMDREPYKVNKRKSYRA